MIEIGRFFFRYRNWIFILFYAALLIPSPPLFSPSVFGSSYLIWPITIGLVITVSGQLIRGLTIGLAYIVRGGKDKKPYAEGLVTEGIFHHNRNPLYIGNILMLLGVGILANSLIYVVIVIPIFMFVYQSIVIAEEHFLRSKFGEAYDRYCRDVPRWLPRFRGIRETFRRVRFNGLRWILMEYTTQFVWLIGITLVLLLKYPELTGFDRRHQLTVLAIILISLLLVYLTFRFFAKTGRIKEPPL